MAWPPALQALVTRARLAARLFRDPAVPLPPKAVPVGAALYLLFPLDFVPDLIPLLGQLDDLGIVLLAIETFVRLSPPGPVAFHQDAIARGRQYGPTPRDQRPGEVFDAEYRREDARR